MTVKEAKVILNELDDDAELVIHYPHPSLWVKRYDWITRIYAQNALFDGLGLIHKTKATKVTNPDHKLIKVAVLD